MHDLQERKEISTHAPEGLCSLCVNITATLGGVDVYFHIFRGVYTNIDNFSGGMDIYEQF